LLQLYFIFAAEFKLSTLKSFNIMARVNSVVIGSGRNKLGEVVLTTANGETFARKYQASVRNPQTAGQVEQRNRMVNCVQLYHAVSNAISVGFTNRKKGWSLFNAFTSANVGMLEAKRYDTIDGIIEDAGGDIVISTGVLGQMITYFYPEYFIVDFLPVQNRLTVGDMIRVFQVTSDGLVLDIQDYVLTQEDMYYGCALIDINPSVRQYKAGAIIHTKNKKASSHAVLVSREENREKELVLEEWKARAKQQYH
jgi:hypothetical protein